MEKAVRGTNPFYVLLVVVGIAFVITTCAYALMAFQISYGPAAKVEAHRGHALWLLLDQHGNLMIGGELIALAFLTFAAMGTDRYWQYQARHYDESTARERR